MKKLVLCVLLILSLIPFYGFSYSFNNPNSELSGKIIVNTTFITQVKQINVDFSQRLKEAEASNSEFGLKTLVVTSSSALQNTFGAVAQTAFFGGITILKFASEEEAETANNLLNQAANVESRPDMTVTASDITPSASASGYTYKTNGANIIGAPQFNEYYNQLPNESKQEVIVAVLDSGINQNHQMFTDRLITGETFVGGTVSDALGHGTHVAGTVADLTLSNVKIMPVKVMDDNGKGSDTTILGGIQYILSQKANGKNIVAANLSLGSSPQPITSAGYKSAKNLWDSMMNSLYNNGILPVVASGNETNRLVDENGNTYGSPNDNYRTLPSGCDNVVAVSAYSSKNGENLTTKKPSIASFSNYGTHIDVSAPGVNIASASNTSNTGLKYLDGTSMATPHVAAAVAMIASDASVSRTMAQIEQLINDSALANADFGSAGWDKYFGWGGLSLLGAINEDSTPPDDPDDPDDPPPDEPDSDDELPDSNQYFMMNYATVVVPARANGVITVENYHQKKGLNSYFIPRSTNAEIHITAKSGYEIAYITVNGESANITDNKETELVIPSVKSMSRYIVLISFKASAVKPETPPRSDGFPPIDPSELPDIILEPVPEIQVPEIQSPIIDPLTFPHAPPPVSPDIPFPKTPELPALFELPEIPNLVAPKPYSHGLNAPPVPFPPIGPPKLPDIVPAPAQEIQTPIIKTPPFSPAPLPHRLPNFPVHEPESPAIPNPQSPTNMPEFPPPNPQKLKDPPMPEVPDKGDSGKNDKKEWSLDSKTFWIIEGIALCFLVTPLIYLACKRK
jgi:subtilisin family serine protease